MPVARSILPVLAVMVAAAGCSRTPATGTGSAGRTNSAGAASAMPATGFRLGRVEVRALERFVDATGSLLPVDETPVSVKVPGRLASIPVDLGSRVKAGDLIATVESLDYDLKVRQAEAALGEARARVGLPLEGGDDRFDVEKSSTVVEARAVLEEATANRDRIRVLSEQGILSTSELETASSAHKVALSRYQEALEQVWTRLAQLQQRRAEYEIARKELADTRLLAPFDGAVQERRANMGEYLTAGAPVVVVVRTDPLRLRLSIPERDAARIRLGQSVRVTVEGDPEAHPGQVTRLSPAFTAQSRTLVVEADVPARDRLRPGAFARARIVAETSAGLVIPPRALVTFAGIEKVFLVRDGKAVEQRVTTGDRGPDWIEVSSGVKEGDMVVLDPGSLRTGDAVVSAAPADGKGS